MCAEIQLRFYEELNDYLPADKRKREWTYSIDAGADVRQVLRALGIPESEVELILINGSSVDVDCVVAAGDRVSVYPVFESLNVKPLLRIRDEPLRRIRFAAEPGLGLLAFSLRSLGFDVVIDSEICGWEEEQRILLSTNRAHLRSGSTRVFVVYETVPERQLKEVLSRLDLCDMADLRRADAIESP